MAFSTLVPCATECQAVNSGLWLKCKAVDYSNFYRVFNSKSLCAYDLLFFLENTVSCNCCNVENMTKHFDYLGCER